MHNNNSNTHPPSHSMGPLEWAQRFVPLPPTEFPEEVAINNIVHERPPVAPFAPSESPLNNASLPCLQDIAGADPFFTPVQPAQSSLAATTPETSQHTPAADCCNVELVSDTAACPPRVEVIGQQVKHQTHTPPAKDKTLPAAALKQQEKEQEPNKVEVENVHKSGFQKPIVEIHEYDLATKVPLNANTGEPQDSNEPVKGADQAAVTEPNITSYWNQDNVSSFIPGITPIEAYPVCQEYVEQISASGDSQSITLSDIELEQLLETTANRTSETPEAASGSANETEASESDEAANIAAGATAQTNAIPLQIDPFALDTFKSTIDVSLAKTSNQFSLQSQATAKNITSGEASIAGQSEVMESVSDASTTTDSNEVNVAQEASTENLAVQNSEPIVPEIPNLAARQIETPSAIEPVADATKTADPEPTPIQTDTTAVNSQLHEQDEVYQESNSNELFESVEKSLSDLQSINRYDSNADFLPTNDVQETFPTASATPIEPQPVSAVVAQPEAAASSELALPESVTEQQPDAQRQTPTFEPIDLTASLTSVQTEAKEPTQPEVAEELSAVEEILAEVPRQQFQTPEMPLGFQSIEQTFLPAVQPAYHQIQQPPEPEITQDAPPVEHAIAVAPEPTQTPVLPAADSMQSSPQATHVAAQQVHQLEEPAVAQEAPTSEPEPVYQVVQVDGDDGYDFLDLKAFDVAHATFLPGKIFLDDGTTKFQIQYKNLNLAVFAGDFQVELS